MHRYLDGRRGWSTVGTLAAALLCVVGGQLYAGTAASASAPAPASRSVAYVAGAEQHDRPVPAAVTARAVAAEQAADAARAEAARQADAAAVQAQAAAQAEVAAQAEADRRAATARSAPTPAADRCSGPGWQQRRGEAALASLGPAAQGSGFTVEFAPARSGYLGLAHLQRRVVEVFVRDCGTQSDDLLRHVIAHELGHAFDTVHMTDASRQAFQAARGIPASVPWYGCSGCSDFATPAGDFAEVYAQWLRGAADNRSQLAGAPGPADLQALAARFFTP